MAARLEVLAIDGILVEAFPFLKSLFGNGVVRLIVPVEHLGVVWYSDTRAEGFDDTFRVVQEVIRIYHANFGALRLTMNIAVGYPLVGVGGSYLANFAEVVEYAADLVVASFGGVEFVEAGNIVERWDSTSVVGWN